MLKVCAHAQTYIRTTEQYWAVRVLIMTLLPTSLSFVVDSSKIDINSCSLDRRPFCDLRK